jgi:hypothetical protein
MNVMETVIPSEATIEDATETNAFVFDYMNLTQATPKEADF